MIQIQTTVVLLLVALLSVIFRDKTLASASMILALVSLSGVKPVLGILEKHSFQIGIFFLMIFLMLPIVTQKTSIVELGKGLASIHGIMGILAGLLIAYLGGKGVNILPKEPALLFGVMIGTLTAVLFFQGLPAGLIIAAGLVGMIEKIFK